MIKCNIKGAKNVHFHMPASKLLGMAPMTILFHKPVQKLRVQILFLVGQFLSSTNVFLAGQRTRQVAQIADGFLEKADVTAQNLDLPLARNMQHVGVGG